MKKLLAFLTVIAVGAGGALLALQPWTSDEVVDLAVDRAIAERVGVRTLTDEITITGQMRRDELQTINSAAGGKVSDLMVADGDTVKAGDTLFSLNGRPSVAVKGGFAFYRTLDVGSQGPDVEQLETVLSEAGYPVGEVDTLYTEDTRAGLAAWQASYGFSGVTSEVDEVVSVSLLGNPAGYRVGAVNTVSVTIGPATPVGSNPSSRQGVTSTASSTASTVNLSASPVVVVEGGTVTVTLTATPAPTTDLEVGLRIAGDVTVEDDYVDIDDTVVIVAGATSAAVEVQVLVDDDLEPNEDLKVEIIGGFDDQAGVAPQTLLIYDLQVQVVDLGERRTELADEIDEAEAGVQSLAEYDLEVEIADLDEKRTDLLDDVAEAQEDIAEAQEDVAEHALEVGALETLARLMTDVEQELMSKGIINMSQAIEADLTSTEAEQLMALDTALDKANDDLDTEDITVAAWRKAFEAYWDAHEAALEESTELVAERDTLEAAEDALEAAEAVLEGLQDEQARLDYLLDDANDRLTSLLEDSDGSLTGLREEQERLDYLFEATSEDLRVAQAARWIIGGISAATVVIDDPEVPDVPVLLLRAESESVGEPGTASFTVETTTEVVEDLDIYFEVTGTATAEQDFSTPAGDITMRAGTDTASIAIAVRSDDLVEIDETLTVQLLTDTQGAYALSSMKAATTRIVSPDLPELNLVGGGRVTEGDTSYVGIVADQAPKVDTSVGYSVSGSAQAGMDYQVVTGSALLAAGETRIDVAIRTISDDVVFMPGDMVVAEWPTRVGKVHIDEGSFVAEGAPVLTLTEPAFTITLLASPTDRAKLSVGQEVTVDLDAGNQESPGVITSLDDSASSQSGSERYEGVVEAVDELLAVEGAVVIIDVVVEEVLDAVVVPIAAVLTDGPEEKVRVVTPDGVIERRTIETGMLDGAWVEVVSGVSPGEYVILEIDRS
ncbi:MAG: Calx-beta domain-containing protein [Actinomycetota bacterium]|nr:Calx-beta domain-containing protein [Actinomycetota bacterium]